MSTLRDTILAEEEIVASKRRFGLFSQPPPLAVGDDSSFRASSLPRGDNGKPITQPPQLLAGPCKTGKMKSSFISNPESIYVKDPYRQQHKIDVQYDRKMHSRAQFHENEFKPAGGNKTLQKAAYDYIGEKSTPTKPVQRDENGKIKTQDRNFTTNSTFKVQADLFKPLKYISDPYDRKRQIEKKQKELAKKKIPADFPMFRSMSHGSKVLNLDVKVYGTDAKAKLLEQSRKAKPKTITSMYPHESNFKLARKGFGDPLAPYPKSIVHQTSQTASSPPKKMQTLNEEGRQSWKPTNPSLPRPTPSISLNPRNMQISRFK